MRAAAATATAADADAGAVESARRALSQSRMHLRGVIKAAESGHWDVEMAELYADLVACAEEVAAAEEAATAAKV